MKSAVVLRIASVITFLYFAGHTSGAPWTPSDEPAAVSVIAAMKSISFNVMGSTRTYWDFYFGFGIIISVYMLMQAVVLWQLASLSKTEPLRVRPVIAAFLAAFIANSFLAWRYIFIIPLVLSLLISI